MEKLDKSIIYKHDYCAEIISRLSSRKTLLNISAIAKETNVPRSVIESFIKNDIGKVNFEHVVALYKFLEDNQL